MGIFFQCRRRELGKKIKKYFNNSGCYVGDNEEGCLVKWNAV
jgi:hypothetical protein